MCQKNKKLAQMKINREEAGLNRVCKTINGIFTTRWIENVPNVV